MDTGELIQAIVEKPSYKKGPRKKRKLREEMINKIKLNLEENHQKKQRGLRKQLKKSSDIHEALEPEGYYVSTVGLNEATIKKYIQDQENTI